MHEDINELIRKNKGLVYKQLHKFNLVDDQDANSYAFEALYNAIQTWDSSLGTKLSTYATVCIYNALGCYLRKLNRKRQIDTVSYNNIANDNAEFSDFISSQYSLEESVINSIRLKAAYDAMQRLRCKYSGVCLKVFEIWYDSNFSMGATDIAKQLGTSQPYVSQTLARIRADIKKEMGDE